ncbi:conserved Plasmodium protein, unknown function [Plasmodium gonderi]|uniref:Leucine-rich repeat protein n=1 Tax=Plasmodium gonderi TaxID=77519 RepID=A0A1Y1JM55_PLAGO|nr:conserved Plasmodium protein, unknown function [Plasmodium gonderi]GAW81463.1 conserved Plasmodium protein, unknown function [Plasmodium gonderi]
MDEAGEEAVPGMPKLMTYKDVKKICKENNLYETDELNEVLYLHMKGFHNIDGLSPFKNLKCLFLNNNCIKKIDNLGGLVNLKALYLQNNNISSIENIECNSLVILNLSNNKIKRICNLEHLKLLQTLNVSNNLIEDIEDIKEICKLENLSHLDLSNNQLNVNNDIIDVSKLQYFIHKLKYDCSGESSNLSEDMSEKKLNEVNQFDEFLHLRNNFHEEVNKEETSQYVKYHQNIESMDHATKKKILFLCEFIVLLRKIKNLKTLLVKNNPFVSKIRHASKYLVANIPNLIFLDDKKIKKEDICLARIFLKKGSTEEMELKKIFEKRKMEKYKNLSKKFHSYLLTKQEGGD